MILHWPQLIMLIFIAAEMGLQIAKHGEPKRGKYNLLSASIAWGIIVYLLYCGGFWQ